MFGYRAGFNDGFSARSRPRKIQTSSRARWLRFSRSLSRRSDAGFHTCGSICTPRTWVSTTSYLRGVRSIDSERTLQACTHGEAGGRSTEQKETVLHREKRRFGQKAKYLIVAHALHKHTAQPETGREQMPFLPPISLTSPARNRVGDNSAPRKFISDNTSVSAYLCAIRIYLLEPICTPLPVWSIYYSPAYKPTYLPTRPFLSIRDQLTTYPSAALFLPVRVCSPVCILYVNVKYVCTYVFLLISDTYVFLSIYPVYPIKQPYPSI